MVDVMRDKMIEENHNLIYKYAFAHNVSLDEYYDVLAEALCRAVSRYDSSKGKLSTLVFKMMDYMLINEYKKRYNKKSIPAECIVYYESNRESEDTNIDYSNLISGVNNNMEEDIVFKLSILPIVKHLPQREKKVYDCLMSGMSYSEIATKMKTTKSTVANIIRRSLRPKFQNELFKNKGVNDYGKM